MTNSFADTILSRYPGPVELLPKLLRWQIMMAVSLTFVVLGGVLAFQGHTAGLWIMAGFAGLAILPAMVALPGAAKLVLDQEGFRPTSLYRGRHVRWEESSDFHLAQLSVSGHKVVVYEDPHLNDENILSKSRFAGYNSAFPDSYGTTPETLAFILNEWRRRALADQRNMADQNGPGDQATLADKG